jgi:hypothetical protein
MTAGITEFAQQAAASYTYDFRSTTVGLVIVLILVVLLTVREVARAEGGERARELVYGVNVVVWPLLIVFSTVMIVRLISLI